MPEAFCKQAVSNGYSGIGYMLLPGAVGIAVEFGTEKVNVNLGLSEIINER